MKHEPKPIDSLVGLPEHVISWLRQHRVATCDQALALVLQLLEAGSDRALPAGLTADDLSLLRDRLEQELPAAIRGRLEEAQHTRWTDERPLGVLPPSTPGRSRGSGEDARPTQRGHAGARRGPRGGRRGGRS